MNKIVTYSLKPCLLLLLALLVLPLQARRNWTLADSLVEQVRERAPRYAKTVSEYRAQLYVKGDLHVDRKNMLLQALPHMFHLQKGVRDYVVESHSDLHYTAPDIYDEKMRGFTGTAGRAWEADGRLRDFFHINVYASSLLGDKLLVAYPYGAAGGNGVGNNLMGGLPPMAGNGITVPFDVGDERTARQVVWIMGESVAQRLRAQGLAASTVSAWGRDFHTLASRSRQMTLTQPTQLTGEICSAAAELLVGDWDFAHGAKLRSLGVRASNLTPAELGTQLDLWGEEARRLRELDLDRTIDDLRRRFGNHAVRRLGELSDPRLQELDPHRDNVVHPVSFFA